jgi:hypothetical protein
VVARYICPRCGEAFAGAEQFREHYVARHPDEPFPEFWDSSESDDEFRSWGGDDPTPTDKPVDLFEDVMEEPPEGTAEAKEL